MVILGQYRPSIPSNGSKLPLRMPRACARVFSHGMTFLGNGMRAVARRENEIIARGRARVQRHHQRQRKRTRIERIEDPAAIRSVSAFYYFPFHLRRNYFSRRDDTARNYIPAWPRVEQPWIGDDPRAFLSRPGFPRSRSSGRKKSPRGSKNR